MILVLASLAIVAAGGAASVLVSKRRFDGKLNDIAANTHPKATVDTSGVKVEIDRFEAMKENLSEVRSNVKKLDIPTPECLNRNDNTQSALNKISKFFEKYQHSTVGTEQVVLALLPTSATGEIFWSFAQSFKEQLPSMTHSALQAMKDGAHIPTNLEDILGTFSRALQHIDHSSIVSAMAHHDYSALLREPLKSLGLEMTGVHAATDDFTHSLSGIKDSLAESIDVDSLTSLTDFDVSGHIPVITIAFSSFREFQLLAKDKTDALTSLKNIGLDAAGAGGGGLVGAKAGALAGSIFGPIGAAIGGVVGAIGGAIGGRCITNNIKQAPLRNAIGNYQSSYETMNRETEKQAKETLTRIHDFTKQKRKEFKNDKALDEIPVVVNNELLTQIGVSLYQFFVEYVAEQRQRCDKIKSSFWYKATKHDSIINHYRQTINTIERQLPSVENVTRNPTLATEALLAITIPKERKSSTFEKNIIQCTSELNELNNTNDTSLLIWSYMVNGKYQQTLNQVADFSNTQMTNLNNLFDQWKARMLELENKVNIEKGKLGLD